MVCAMRITTFRLRSLVTAGLAAAWIVALAGCATAPSGAPAAAAAAATNLSSQSAFLNAEGAGSVDEGSWWARLGDPLLDQLIHAALAANHDVRIALARVQQARAGTDAATARLLPSVNAVAAGSSAETGYDAAVRTRLPNIDARRAALDVSWEIDLFGAARAARNAADADRLAAEQGRRGAQLAVISEVARQYLTLRGAQARLAIVDALIVSQSETLRLTELRRAAGQASDFDVDRAQAELAATQAARPALQTLISATQYRLSTLTARAPGAWTALDATAPQAEPLTVGSGQPAELLRRRPDVMAAEAQLRATGFRRDEATANRFPRILLSALFGRQWTEWNALDFGATRFANVAATLALPLYSGGRIQAGIDAANAREQEALAQYERTLLQALEEVEGSLVALRNQGARSQDLDLSVASRERALVRARALYREGQADLLVVLDVERGLLAAQLDRAMHRTDQLLAIVQLYRALGGGWQAAESGATAAVMPSAPHTAPAS
jgi:NodT family efflux transporter outer membrane factor (OMF) lipoprotein